MGSDPSHAARAGTENLPTEILKVDDLPDEELRRRLRPVLELRALLPQARVQSDSRTLSLLDDEEKTTLRLLVASHTLLDDEGRPVAGLGQTVHLEPLKGYAGQADRIGRHLERDLALAPCQESLLQMALAARGRSPGEYSSRFQIDLRPDMRSEIATGAILLSLLDQMERNQPGVMADLDPEFLHDFRVAVRRTRSALTQIKGVYPVSRVEHYREEFRWLGRSTGPTRDLDVYLQTYPAYRQELPADVRQHLAPLHDFLLARQGEAHGELVRTLESERYCRLVRSWRAFLQSPARAAHTAQATGLPNAGRPILEIAGERIWRVYRRVLKQGRSIDAQSPAASLHGLRITCKKLRYLLEFFQSLYPGSKVKPLIRSLRNLQSNLGDFQDFEIQSHHLWRFGEQMQSAGEASAATFMAMGMLVAHLAEKQARTRAAFADRFGEFDRGRNRKRFKALFAQD